MFGLALRTYQRKVQRLAESNTDRGRSLWEAVFQYLDVQKIATRNQVMARFNRDDDQLVRGVLHDLTESGLIFSSGTGDGTVYRAATKDDVSYVRGSQQSEAEPALDTMLWAVIYREGPLTRDELIRRLPIAGEDLDASLGRLQKAQRVESNEKGAYGCKELDHRVGSCGLRPLPVGGPDHLLQAQARPDAQAEGRDRRQHVYLRSVGRAPSGCRGLDWARAVP
jgi:hypothetical protein